MEGLAGSFFRRFAGIGILGVVLLFASFFGASPSQGAYPEVSRLEEEGSAWSFEETARFFEMLAEAKGAPYAFEVLARAPFPPGTDLHLLGHGVGDILYQQQGVGGIAVCTDNFRNACSHSIVIGALLERGESALSEIGDVCMRAPGGGGAYTMCFHGLGHGVLAFAEYDLKEAVRICAVVGSSAYNYRESHECVGGAIMELIAGVHDRFVWEKRAPLFFKKSDPLYPCTASFMPEEAKPLCYSYLTPHLFEAAGGLLAAPVSGDFEKAFRFCDRIPKEEEENRGYCFGGFGKEFVVLAHARDIRSVERMGEEELRQVISWCGLAPHEEGFRACVRSAVASLYWGGENDPSGALRLCSLLEGNAAEVFCFDVLITEAGQYEKDGVARERLCNSFPSQYVDVCRAFLLGEK